MTKIYKCPVCGKELENPPYYNDCCSDECFHIDFWRNALDDEAIIIDGHCYHIGIEPGDAGDPEDPENCRSFLGFGGQEFKIRKFGSDEIIVTHNLWHQGEVPLEFNKQDNAQFVKV